MTTTKACFKCLEEKPLDEFYKNPNMADGRLGNCKECQKKNVTENRKNNAKHYREYRRKISYEYDREYNREYTKRFPNKRKAHFMVLRAVRDKQIFPMPCEVCGEGGRCHAHHDDYAKPLSVRWLCSSHHKQWHKKNGEGLNGGAYENAA